MNNEVEDYRGCNDPPQIGRRSLLSIITDKNQMGPIVWSFKTRFNFMALQQIEFCFLQGLIFWIIFFKVKMQPLCKKRRGFIFCFP